jgi:hypothetical protein
MADKFKRIGNENMGAGGFNCFCCGPSYGSDHARFRRECRRRLKQQFLEELRDIELSAYTDEDLDSGGLTPEEAKEIEDTELHARGYFLSMGEYIMWLNEKDEFGRDDYHDEEFWNAP